MNTYKIASSGWSIGKSLKFAAFGFFIFYIIVSGFMVAVDKKDIGAGISYIGEEMFNPINSAYQEAHNIKQMQDDNLIVDMWRYLAFYSALLKIYLWLYVLYKLLYLFLGQSNVPLIIYLFTLLVFFAIQLGHLLIKGEDVNLLWRVWVDIAEVILAIFK